MNKIRTVFAGTPSFAIPSIKTLVFQKEYELVGVYTQPDKPAGRGKKIMESAVKKALSSFEVPIFQPNSLSDEDALKTFRSLQPELFVVAAYGLMIPRNFLEIPCYCVNVHASLLPRWRGAAPIQRAIMNGDLKTGISIMRIVEELDAGPILNIKERKIESTDTTATLTEKLAQDGADALKKCLQNIVQGSVSEKAQEEANALYAKKISKTESLIAWTAPAEATNLKIRALSPRPGATAYLGKILAKVISARISEEISKCPPGTLNLGKKNILAVATTTKDIQIELLQLPGKKIMTAKDFLNGYRKLL